MMKKIDIIFALFYYILEGKRIGEPDKNMGSNIRKRNDFSKHQQILDLDHREVKFHFFTKKQDFLKKSVAKRLIYAIIYIHKR